MSHNALIGAVFGGMLGISCTFILMSCFTAVSTNQFVNYYIGGLFMAFGAILLYRVHRRRAMVSMDVSGAEKKNDEEEVETASLLTSE